MIFARRLPANSLTGRVSDRVAVPVADDPVTETATLNALFWLVSDCLRAV